jgi:hypothetical protein
MSESASKGWLDVEAKERTRDIYFFLGKTGSNPGHIHNTSLYDPHIGKILPSKGFQLLLLSFSLLFLLRKTFVTKDDQPPLDQTNFMHSLLRRYRLEFHSVVGVDTTAGRATLVQILFDVVPAEPTDLERLCESLSKKTDVRSYLVTADTGLEVEIGNVHLFQTQRAFRILL